MLQLLPTCEVLVSSRLGSQVYRLSISVLVHGVAIPDRSEHASRKYKEGYSCTPEKAVSEPMAWLRKRIPTMEDLET